MTVGWGSSRPWSTGEYAITGIPRSRHQGSSSASIQRLARLSAFG
jgi:hypothetical protein